ncbi:Verru_Chthon cassette protein B [Terrimicrobium sacchariphilum]|uniref:Verru_Chthon cassette protein B n=1 Tax=Terrimicrobium sacchariphilum TaxID=690879 RepID=A0A146G4P1_TERSA|nr:Verru_Chthon cassette protein B [Terrimicrobium sacchariphilum]GAT32590.1 Verru_Chthon cassette protein B [Terrimicrobium sacchariphilum]
MGGHASIILRHRRGGAARRAFSLVEVTIAIGIVAFAFVALVGVLPVGLQTFRRAVDASIGAQITQRILNDIQQTDFDVLVGGHTSPFLFPSTTRYFDDQGSEVTMPSSAVYHVKTWINPTTDLPGGGSTPASNGNLATVTIQIVNNPGNRSLATDGSTGMWNDRSVGMVTTEAFVAKNR